MGSSILKMNRFGLLSLLFGLLAITCLQEASTEQELNGENRWYGYYKPPHKPGGGGKCKDKYDEKKCIKMKEAGKCEDKKVAKKCMKTCDMCEDEGPKKTPFELIDENSDGNITRDEWQMKIKLAMDKVMHITNVTLDEDYENLYDDIWEALDCNNATAIDMEDWEMLLDGENQCGDKLDSWFHFAFNAVVSIIQIVCQKGGYGPKNPSVRTSLDYY